MPASRSEREEWTALLGAFGNAAKGVVYCVVGLLAFEAARGGGGTEGSQGAVREIGRQPFGSLLLTVLALGLVSYALWRFAQAFPDVGRLGSDAGALVRRAAYFVSGVIYGFLAVVAVRLVLGSSGGSGSQEGVAAAFTSSNAGRIVLGAAGVAIVCVGIHQIASGAKAGFMKRYRLGEMSERARHVAKRTGQAGMAARGLTFGIVGVFVVKAALDADPNQTKGLGEALGTLASQPYGPYLLGAVALGFICYGVYCFFRARYYRLEA